MAKLRYSGRQGFWRIALLFALVIGFSLAAVVPSHAATCTWTGSSGTNWNDGGNWDGGLPGDGDAVIVPNTPTKPTMQAGTYPAGGSYLSFEVQAGAIVTCLGNTGAVNEASGGTVAKPHGTGVAVNCQSALIDGTMTADSRGFPGAARGYRGPTSSAWGGSHGGMTMRDQNPSARYGSLTNPTALGNGDYNFMPGGGAIKIAAVDALTVNGIVTANGQGDYSAAGAGGSVWLVCNQFAGTGTVSALGGSSPRAGENASGGGGRISIECQDNAFSGAIKVAGGCGPGPGYGVSRSGGMAQPGTLWFPKWLEGREGTQANPTNLWLPGPQFGVRYWFADSTATQFWNVYMTNSWLEIYAGSAVISNLLITNGCFWVNETNMSNLVVSGNMYLTNVVSYLPPYGVYDMAGDFTMADTNTVVYVMSDTNAVNADSGGTEVLKHGIGLGISCRNAFIMGTINGFGKGFSGSANGGPGQGIGWGGGNYGGRQSLSSGVRCYGSLTRPTALGSSGYHTSAGGGAVRLTASGNLTLEGTINVNGTFSSSGGSGGSVWLQAGTFAGSGRIRADGADTTLNYTHGRGGGGRVAIEYQTWNFAGSYSVMGGTNYGEGVSARTGTVFLCQTPWLGTTTSNGVNGRRLDTSFSVSSNDVQVARVITRFDTSLHWSDVSTFIGSSAIVTNVAVYTASGLLPSRLYSVYVDGTNQFGAGLLSGLTGTLVFTNTLDGLHDFVVTPAAQGSVISFW